MTNTAQEQDAILRTAVMQVKPEYFSWPIEEQERYRVAAQPDEWFRVQQIVLRTLFQIEVATRDEIDNALRGFNDAQRALLSGTLLPLRGIGEDFFLLNESLGDKTLLDFTTLYDYDVWEHCFQEDAREKESPGYVPQPHRGSLYLSWARLFIDGRFYYATLSMAAGYLRSATEEAGYQQMEKLIPHRYVDGERHGKRTMSGSIWDQRVDAGGIEGQLKELRSQFWRYLDDRYEKLQQEFDSSASAAVWILDRSTTEENHVHFVFSDKTALQQVKLRHFLHDCRSLQKCEEVLKDAVEAECTAVARFIYDSHARITQGWTSIHP